MAGLKKSAIAKAVAGAFKAIGDIPRTLTYYVIGDTQTFDEDAGRMVYGTIPYPIKSAVIAKFTQRETDKDPTFGTSEKMIFQTAELPSGVVPKSMDWAIDDQGQKWEIVKLLTDPAAIVTILQVRAP